jgi:hydrogenase nickel incorporation protein HypB
VNQEKRIEVITIEEEIHADNAREAAAVRAQLARNACSMVNLMSSPGAGKTSLIMRSLEALSASRSASAREQRPLRCCVIEADMDSEVDAEKLAARGIDTLQIRTGGFCHVDAYMVSQTLRRIDSSEYDLLILENVGNLICPAQFDTGANLNVMLLSVPEGDDKPLKYPLMFRRCDALVVNKIDYLALEEGFDLQRLRSYVEALNPQIEIFPLSCRSGEGIEAWVEWLDLTTETRLQEEQGTPD